MEAVLNPSFSIGYEKTKKEIYEELNSRIDTVILNSMKGYLREKNVQFDSSSIDLKEFKDKVVPTLDKKIQIDIANIEKGLNEQLSNVTESLKKGSTTAFRKFAEGIGKFSKSTVEMIARLTAVKTAYLLSPTAGSVAVGASIMAPKIIRTAKDIKKDMKDNTKAALDVMLLKLGTATQNGKIQYDVPEESRKLIASNLKSEGIDISTEDTIHFLQDISNLDNNQKEKAVNMLNNMRGNPYDVKEEVSKTKINLSKIKKIIGDDIVSPLSTAALFGMAAGSTLTETMPDLAPSVITALSAGGITGDLGVGVISGGAQYALSKFGHYIPVIGDVIEDVTREAGAKETILATTGTAAIAKLGLKIVPNLVFKGTKGILHKIKNKKEAEARNKKLEDNVAVTDVERRIKRAQEDVNDEITERSDKDILMDVIKDTLRCEGISIPREVRTQEELKVYVNRLSDKEKKEVYKITSVLEDIKENNTKSLKTTLSKVAKTAYWGGVLALAGLGAYDAFINPGFIEGLSKKDEVEQELQQLNDGIVSQEKYIEEQEKIIKKHQDELAEKLNEKINEAKEFLPEKIEDTKLLLDPGFLPAKNCVGNRVVIKGMNLNSEEGLLTFFKSINPNDERLLDLMGKANVSDIEELANSDYIKQIVNEIGNNTYFLSGYGYGDGFGEYLKFELLDKRQMRTNMIELVNNQFAENLSNVPLKSATEEEINNFIQSLITNPDKINYLATYIEATEQMDGNFIMENIEDLLEDWKLIPEEKTTITEAIGKITKAQKAIKEYNQEIIEKSQGIEDGIKADFPRSPEKIFAGGAITGAVVGSIGEVAKKVQSFFKDKFFRKNKALPSGQPSTDEKEVKKASNRKRLDVTVDENQLNKEEINFTKETKKEDSEKEI